MQNRIARLLNLDPKILGHFGGTAICRKQIQSFRGMSESARCWLNGTNRSVQSAYLSRSSMMWLNRAAELQLKMVAQEALYTGMQCDMRMRSLQSYRHGSCGRNILRSKYKIRSVWNMGSNLPMHIRRLPTDIPTFSLSTTYRSILVDIWVVCQAKRDQIERYYWLEMASSGRKMWWSRVRACLWLEPYGYSNYPCNLPIYPSLWNKGTVTYP